ncbi:MAG: sensor histidine kinase [Salinibacterium sp.]|nr:sensor histidine kinase [Salinibacterium sp.]
MSHRRADAAPDPRNYDRGMPFHGRARQSRWEVGYHQWQRDQFMEELALRPPHQFRSSSSARLLIPVVASLIIQLPAALFWLVRTPGPAVLAIAILAILGPLSLLLRRRFPGPVVAFVAAAACADFFLATQFQGPPFMALAFAIVLSIVHGARVWAWISVGAAWVGTVAVGVILGLDWHPARIAITTLGILITFGIGEAIRTRREHDDEFRRAVAQRKQSEVQAERVRIARELHDVLAHSLSQINVQAGVGLHLMDKQPEKAAEALASIKETSKTALDEVRSVLGVLRAEGGQDPSAPLVPEPDLSRLPGLAASVTSQGVEVALTNTLDDVPKAVQLALYRIVQESLTNVVRHAKATRARVDLRVDGPDYVVSIGDDGTGIVDGSNGGRGLLGMSERAELLGGTLSTGNSPAGGTLVTARIPVKEHDS